TSLKRLKCANSGRSATAWLMGHIDPERLSSRPPPHESGRLSTRKAVIVCVAFVSSYRPLCLAPTAQVRFAATASHFASPKHSGCASGRAFITAAIWAASRLLKRKALSYVRRGAAASGKNHLL